LNKGLIMANRPLRPKQVAQIKSDDVVRAGRVTRTAVGSAVAGGAIGAGMKASDMANPGTIDRVVSKVVEDPYSTSSSVRDVFERVPLPAAPMNEIISSAADVGWKVALGAAAVAAAAKGIQVGKERRAQKAAYHQANAISRALTLNPHITKNYKAPN
jgi:hypothetical protein